MIWIKISLAILCISLAFRFLIDAMTSNQDRDLFNNHPYREKDSKIKWEERKKK